jgi:hypothetical protein
MAHRTVQNYARSLIVPGGTWRTAKNSFRHLLTDEGRARADGDAHYAEELGET